MRIDENIRRLLENEVKIHMAEIRFLYEKLDHKFGLHAARIPVTFGFEEDSLGSYTPKAGQNEEEFHFSLFKLCHTSLMYIGKKQRLKKIL